MAVIELLRAKCVPGRRAEWLQRDAEIWTPALAAHDGYISKEVWPSIDNPDEFVLIEAFKEDAAEAHVTSEHFKRAQATFPAYLVETPLIRNVVMPGDHWDRLGEFEVSAS